MSKSWAGGSTTRWRRIRGEVLARDGHQCQLRIKGICTGVASHVHHTKGRAITGDDPRYLVASCPPCNLHLGDVTKPKRDRYGDQLGFDLGPAGQLEKFTELESLDTRVPVFLSPLTIRTELEWNPDALLRYDWLEQFADVPDDASPPLAMSLPAADAVGSYGGPDPARKICPEGAVAWIERTQKIKLRWWQALAVTRQLEHREDGTLCSRTVVESCPRRAGKSVRIRGVALWRLSHAELFGEVQTVVHTGSDVAICREIQRGAWHWAEAAGWTVGRANGKEAVETLDGDRWLVRAQRAVYGYDVCLGVVDEGWDVQPDTVTEGLEPAMLERSSPQLHLTSTAHRRATSLMRTSLTHAMSTDDPKVLLLLWGARPGVDPADPEVWRAANPHWSEDRRSYIAGKYEKALAGDDDPEFDDPDPIRGFEAQYLNIWRLKESRTVGDPVIAPEAWAELAGEMPDRVPDAVAVEDWFAEGVSVARAWRLDDGVAAVKVTGHADVAEAAAAVAATRLDKPAMVGESIADDPAWAAVKVRTTARQGALRAVVADLDRLLSKGALIHDGGDTLTKQVLDLRTSPGVDGARIRSTAPAEAVKAAVWAANQARTTRPKSKLVVL